eukprot:XP_001706127.1 Hypothetical protein GL50803_36071 [Giardia lamblia ATCC 50803]
MKFLLFKIPQHNSLHSASQCSTGFNHFNTLFRIRHL